MANKFNKSELIDNVCGLVCVTPEEVFASFGAISPVQPKYEYLGSTLVKTGDFVIVYLLDLVLEVELEGCENMAVGVIIGKALRQLDVGTIHRIRSVWVSRMADRGYGDRLKDFYL